jgi:hypothetical protein
VAQLVSPEDMGMQVLDKLAGIRPGVDDQPVTLFGDTLIRGNFLDGQQQMAQQAFIPIGDVIRIGDVFLGDDQDVNGCSGVDIMEGQDLVVFIHDLCGYLAGYDLTKYAIVHGVILK